VAEWGRLRFGAGDTPEERRLADLENTLQLIGLDAAEYAPLLGPLFDVPLPEDRAAKFAPEAPYTVRRCTMDASIWMIPSNVLMSMTTRR
jgi:hypothetical protein